MQVGLIWRHNMVWYFEACNTPRYGKCLQCPSVTDVRFKRNTGVIYKKVKLSRYRPGEALGFQEVVAPEFLGNQHMKVVRLSVLRTGRLYHQEGFLVLISVRGWVDLRATMRSVGLSHWKIPVTSSGIEPATFRLLAQCLNQLRHRLPRDTVIPLPFLHFGIFDK
jgi:hypothetical protein